MKKILIIIVLMIFCFLCNIKQEKSDSIAVFKETDNNYNIYQLDVSYAEITTKNINKYFTNDTIIDIEIVINPIYSNLINIKKYNFDTNKSIKHNIDEFNDIYIQELQNNSLVNEINNFNYYGLKIDKITLYITHNRLDLILKNNKMQLIQ